MIQKSRSYCVLNIAQSCLACKSDLMYRKIQNSFSPALLIQLQVDGFLDKVSSNEHVGGVMLVCSSLLGCSRPVPAAHESA